MNKRFIALALLCSNFACVALSHAQLSGTRVDVRDADAEMYPADVSYDPAIPRPETVLGHELGAEPVRHHHLVDYLTALAEASDRIDVEVIGYSHERRPILFLTVTSPRNHSRIEAIRDEHAALTEPGQSASVSADMPVVTWLNYGVHGAEASGMDAALPFVYYLAAAEGPAIEEILDSSIVLVTAVFNPDGHAKRIAWLDAWGSERVIADPGHMEHLYNWQYARTNHYWFDLNRQWLLLTQPEARAWMKKWHEWRPNLTIDYHEMGSDQTYYFHPGVRTRTNPLVPAEAERLMEQTVETSEAFLDAEGRLYFHGEGFDNFYVGKGSTFPLVNGGVGILYEAAASLGREIETGNGLRTYRENIRKHFRTSIASIEAAAGLRTEYLEYQRDFYRDAADAGRKYATGGWVYAAPGDPARQQFFTDLLNFHRIETYRLARDIDIDGQSFREGEAVVVPAAQAQHRLIRSIFEPVTEFEDQTFYDVSTWTMPPAFGLESAALAGRAYNENLSGERAVATPPVTPPPDAAGVAYAFEWKGYYAPRALNRLLESEVLARVATQPFSATSTRGTVEFGRGSIIVPFDRQPLTRDTIHLLMNEIAAEDGVVVHALTSGRSSTGTEGFDLGGPSFRTLKQPNVLLVTGDMINLYDAGEAWHLLDWRMQMPVTLRSRETLASIDWSRYTHIVFPPGEYEEYEADFAPRLRLWVAEGGTVIGLRNAVPWLRANTLDWLDPESPEGIAAAEKLTAETAAELAEQEPGLRTDYADKAEQEALELVGGAIFEGDLDNTHPLGFGYDMRRIYLHKNFKDPLEDSDNPFATVIRYAEAPVYSGYVSADNSEVLAGTPALLAERSGLGSVVLFADNPNFRGYWYGTNKLFMNAVFFSTVYDPPADF